MASLKTLNFQENVSLCSINECKTAYQICFVIIRKRKDRSYYVHIQIIRAF